MDNKIEDWEHYTKLIIAFIAACCVPWGWSFAIGVGIYFLIDIGFNLFHIKNALVSKKETSKDKPSNQE
jgi:hypothetical protein